MPDTEYLAMAYTYAQASQDPSTQNGAVLVKDGRILSYGVNNFPDGVKTNHERWERPLKYKFVEHAERQAIYTAAKNGQRTEGATLYVPWWACTDCARGIIQSGIKEVIGHDTMLHATAHPDWIESIKLSLDMFDEAGIIYRNIKGNFGLKIRFNGSLVEV